MMCKKCGLYANSTRCLNCRKYNRIKNNSCVRCGRKQIKDKNYKTCKICRNSKHIFNISSIIRKHIESNCYLVH